MGRVTLGDGRVLAYAEYGRSDGVPVLYCHGFLGSRLEASLTQPVAADLGLRVVAPDRPGYGASSYQCNRRLADWPRDVATLADALGFDRFAVLGVSGGGPYALACAALLPERVMGAGVVCGLGPLAGARHRHRMRLLARASYTIARHLPGLAQVLARGLPTRSIRHRPIRILALLASTAPTVDREVLCRSDVRDTLAASLREALAQGGRGAAGDLVIYSHPWPIDLQRITVPVHLWHGEQDATVPVAVARQVSASLPQCRAEFLRLVRLGRSLADGGVPSAAWMMGGALSPFERSVDG